MMEDFLKLRLYELALAMDKYVDWEFPVLCMVIYFSGVLLILFSFPDAPNEIQNRKSLSGIVDWTPLNYLLGDCCLVLIESP